MTLFALDRGASLLLRQAESRYNGGPAFEGQLAAYLARHPADTLVLGTSRAYEGIVPSQLEACGERRVLKEAFQGKGPKYQLHFYRLFKKLAGRPKLVIWGVDYFIYAVESDQRWMSRFEADDAVLKADALAAPLLLWRQKLRNDLFFNHLVQDLSTRLAGDAAPDAAEINRVQAYTGQATRPPSAVFVPDRPASFKHQGMPPAPGTEGRYLDQLLDETEADGVRVALVSLPDYIGTYRTNVETRRFHRVLRKLAARHSNVTVLAYDDPALFDLANPDLFLDGGYGRSNSHLSARGAAEVTRMLCADLAQVLQE